MVRRGGLLRVNLDNCKFVTAEPGDKITLPRRVPQALADLAQQVIARGMTQRVIDRLEPVEIQIQQCDSASQPQPRQDPLQMLVEQQPVRQRGQRVVPSHVGKQLL